MNNWAQSTRCTELCVPYLRTGLLGLLICAGAALAQSSGGPYTLNPQVIANGGGRATGGAFEIEASIGQHDASNPQTGGVFEISAGFHRRAGVVLGDPIFSNGFE
jgi:hypothetical protein